MSHNPFTRACLVSGCPHLATMRGRCPSHARQVDTARSLSSDRSHRRLYNSARWRRTRLAVLAAHPLCACHECRGAGLLATVVHHVRPHGGDEGLFFDVHNLQAVAKPCHDRITARGGGSTCWDTRCPPDRAALICA